ncbi:MAG: CPBP family intramembrane metalloprotease [Ruminococcaceae bacterium]|nr:CPBP family intramembrane metalloprotease [Oscillospiraceae bacterium]
MVLALVTAIRYIDPEMLAMRDNIYLSIVILQFLVFLLPAALYTKIKGKGYVSTLNMKMFAPDSIAFVLICAISTILGSAALRFVCEQASIPRSDMILMRTCFESIAPATDPLFLILAYALTPAIAEEFIFRGIIISEYRSGGRICAVIMSSLLFSFLHFRFQNFILAFFIGVMLSFAVYVTGSLWSAIIIRFLYNLYSIFLETRLFEVLDRPKNTIFMIFIFAGLFLTSLVLLLGVAEKMFYSYALLGKEPPLRDDSFVYGKLNLKASFISLPFIFCVIVYIITSL